MAGRAHSLNGSGKAEMGHANSREPLRSMAVGQASRQGGDSWRERGGVNATMTVTTTSTHCLSSTFTATIQHLPLSCFTC